MNYDSARERGRADARFRRYPSFRRAADGRFERLESMIRGWVAVETEDAAEAAAYLEGWEKERKT